MRQIENSKEFRNNILKKILFIFENEINEEKAKNIETGIYNYSIKEATNRNLIKKWENVYFVQIYTDRFRSLFNNFKKNPNLKSDIKNNKFNFSELAFMAHQEMEPQRWQKLIDAKQKRDKNKYEKRQITSSEFTCYKCKSNECTHYQMQTRSADEPMTTFVTCLSCGNRWKF